MDLQTSFWTFASFFYDQTKEPRCLLSTAPVNGESKASMAIVVYHLDESYFVLYEINTITFMLRVLINSVGLPLL